MRAAALILSDYIKRKNIPEPACRSRTDRHSQRVLTTQGEANADVSITWVAALLITDAFWLAITAQPCCSEVHLAAFRRAMEPHRNARYVPLVVGVVGELFMGRPPLLLPARCTRANPR